MIIVIDDYGVDIARENASFLISKGEEKRSISPHRVTAIHVRKPCNISTPAILLAAEHGLPLLFFSTAGKVKARLWQPHFGSHARIRHMQMAHSHHDDGLDWVRAGISLKADGQCTVLKWLVNRVPSQATALNETVAQVMQLQALLLETALEAEKIRSLEAQMGRVYWEAYFSALDQYEAADKRSRRPAQDPLNALLNYGYGMLYGEVESATLTAGLDPHIGILHREEFGKPAFVFDAIEPYRPWVDRLVAELAIGGQIKRTWFEIGTRELGLGASPEGVPSEGESGLVPKYQAVPHWLTKEGKKAFIPAWYAMINSRNLFNQKQVKRKDQIQYHLTTLAQHLLKDFKPE